MTCDDKLRFLECIAYAMRQENVEIHSIFDTQNDKGVLFVCRLRGGVPASEKKIAEDWLKELEDGRRPESAGVD